MRMFFVILLLSLMGCEIRIRVQVQQKDITAVEQKVLEDNTLIRSPTGKLVGQWTEEAYELWYPEWKRYGFVPKYLSD